MKKKGIFILSRGFILLYIGLSSTGLQAQFYSKRSVLLGGISNGVITSTQVVNDTVYAMCGVIDTLPPYKSIGTFNIYDKNGNVLSKQKVDIPDQRYIGNERDNLIRTLDGGFIYAGYAYADTDNSLMLLKYSKGGNLQWYRTFSDSGKYWIYNLTNIIQYNDGSFFASGMLQYRSNYDVGNFIAKFDSVGNLLLLNIYNTPTIVDGCYSLCTNRKGNIVMGGQASYFNNVFWGIHSTFYEIDTGGHLLNYLLGTDTFGSIALSILACNNGDYLTAGLSICSIDSPHLYNHGNIARFDSNFHRLWVLELGPCGGFNTQFSALKLLPDSNYLAVGKWFDPADDSHYDQYGWLVKFTPDGTVLWERRYRGIYNPLPYGDESQLMTVGLFSDNTIITAGEATDRSASRNSQQGWLLHLDANGCLPDSNSCGIISGIKEASRSPNWAMRLYPDPASDRFTLDYQLSGAGIDRVFIVTDVWGREIYKEIITETSGSLSVQTGAWQSGLYYCTILDGTGIYSSKAVSIIH